MEFLSQFKHYLTVSLTCGGNWNVTLHQYFSNVLCEYYLEFSSDVNRRSVVDLSLYV